MDNRDEKPPSNMGFSTRILFAYGSLVRRFKNIRELWAGDWSLCPIRTALHSRCYIIPLDIPRQVR